MKNSFYLLVLLFCFSSCREDDDSKDNCTGNCTTLTGKIVSLNNEPVANVRVTLEYRIGGYGGSSTRKIVSVNTDSNGNYYKDFFVKDEELGNNAPGYFLLNFDDSKLDNNKYIRTNNNIGNTTAVIGGSFQISKRDTVIVNNLYFPKKMYIKVNLKNFASQASGDYFEVQSLYPLGFNVGYNDFLESPYATGFSGYENFRATSANTTHNVFVAAGEKNVVRIFRRKNGVNTSKDSLMFIPQGANIELNYSY